MEPLPRLRLRLRSLTQAPKLLRPSHVHVFLLCSVHAWRGCPLLLPLRRRPDRLSTLHAKGLLSPRQARCQIRLGDPDDGAPRPSRRRLRHLGCAPPRSAALRRLFPRPRISRPAPRQANRGDAAPPPRQRWRRLTARLSEEESLRLFPNVERPYCYGKSPSYRVLVGLFLCRRLSSVTETNTRIELRLNIFSI